MDEDTESDNGEAESNKDDTEIGDDDTESGEDRIDTENDDDEGETGKEHADSEKSSSDDDTYVVEDTNDARNPTIGAKSGAPLVKGIAAAAAQNAPTATVRNAATSGQKHAATSEGTDTIIKATATAVKSPLTLRRMVPSAGRR
ncbi:hypothetical protein BGZ97_000768 [Linnemannia gamsii]|uniref:Uncharacterized protein n=1 Tax=Linnemannia gamsii TaxID=64522 RepID=A0A9P6QXL4_9FUNG|nr:hypothetical protein BGZ97_000768 [Linnemannia gamsii]